MNRDIKSRMEYQKQYGQYLKEVEEGSNPKKPVCRQRLIYDATPEAMMKIMAENPAGVCVFCDEVSTFHSNVGRYNKSGFESMMPSLFGGVADFKIMHKGKKFYASEFFRPERLVGLLDKWERLTGQRPAYKVAAAHEAMERMLQAQQQRQLKGFKMKMR